MAVNPQQLQKAVEQAASECRRIVTGFADEVLVKPLRRRFDPLNLMAPFAEAGLKLMRQPGVIARAQLQFLRESTRLGLRQGLRLLGESPDPVVTPPDGDRRFRDPAWREQPLFDFIKQSHLLAAEAVQQTVADVQGLDEVTRERVAFFSQQFVDAMAPSNFLLTNPVVLQETVDKRGENLVQGFRNLLRDLKAGDGRLRVKMTDFDAFKVGDNLAVTPGKVVYENALMQLIQYSPTTKQVFQRPLLIVPPWINKYYILDLKPENSFIRWAVDKGYTVFIISWINPDRSLSNRRFDDYMVEGIFEALEAVRRATGEETVNAVGYCIGGTLLAATLAYMSLTGDERIQSATFLTTQVDFSEPGELGLFIDEAQLDALSHRMQAGGGILNGRDMALTFNMLRANDLIWSFVVNNYLLGREPMPFDLLYWNADATRMPQAMHDFYLREMYLHNRLVEPGGIELNGLPIDLRLIDIPVYLQSAEGDHIAPYPSVYKATRHFSGPIRFMLAGSGHIAGVVNPPAANKYQYWVNDSEALPEDVEEWRAAATEHAGSWWPDWHQWLYRRSGRKVPARVPGDSELTVLEDAPGRYVRA